MPITCIYRIIVLYYYKNLGGLMFYRFENQEMRRNFGGSAFIEIQYCKLKPETKTKK